MIRSRLLELGADPRSIVELDRPSPAAARYLDLVGPQGAATAVAAVIEFGTRPLAYYVPAQAQDGSTDHQRLRHRLASRGDPAYLLIERVTHLDVTPVALGSDVITWRRISAESPLALQVLAIEGWDAFGIREAESLPPAEDGEQLSL